jgi:hypothetical protein
MSEGKLFRTKKNFGEKLNNGFSLILVTFEYVRGKIVSDKTILEKS